MYDLQHVWDDCSEQHPAPTSWLNPFWAFLAQRAHSCFSARCCLFSPSTLLFFAHRSLPVPFFFSFLLFFCFVSLSAVSLRCQTVAAGGPSVEKGKPIVWTAKDTHVLFMPVKYQLVTHVCVCTKGEGGGNRAIGDNSFDECRKPVLTSAASRRCCGDTKQPVNSSRQTAKFLVSHISCVFSVSLCFSPSFRCSSADSRSREKQVRAGPMPAP